jgi:type IV secretory pathway TrbL component
MVDTTEDVSKSKLRQIDARIHSILVTEARAFASTAVLSMQVAALFWGRSTTGQSGDWWQFLIMSIIMLGIVAWQIFSGRVKDRSTLIKMVWSEPLKLDTMG